MITRALLTLALCLGLASPSWAAVGFGTISASGSGTNSIAAQGYPASIAAGDLLIYCVANKYPTNGPSTPTGWTLAGQGTADTGDGPGADLGATYATVFTKIADGTESGTFTLTVTSGNATFGYIARYTNATGQWLTASATGGDSTSGTAWSATMGSDPGITGGDMVIACSARNSSAGLGSASGITTTGITYGTSSERGDNGTGFNDNVGAYVSDHVVTSGTSAGSPVYTFTNSTATGGGTVILRIREDNAAAPTTIQSNQGFLGVILQ